MLEIERKIYIFKTKQIWFADYPFNVNGYDSVSFHACKNKVDIKGFIREEFTTLIIDLTQDLDVIWKNMSKSSCRYAINRAQRDGVKIKLNQNYEEFYEIVHSFRKAKGLPAHPEKIDFMKKYGILFVAEFDGEIIGGNLYIADKNNIRWLTGASKRLGVNREKATLIGNANRLILWETIKYAKEKGIREFDMGGYYTGGDTNDPRYTINIFKKSFGGVLTTNYIYRKETKLYKFAKKIYQLKQVGVHP
ncbi:MAG: GNAT family N-acetyltransferase [Thermotogae bacterium]|nr:GNAT family N-acetyltransferase [Thermotogota bacterium]